MGAEWLHSNRQKDGGMDITKLIIFFFLILRKGVKKNKFLLYVFFWVIPLRLNFICRRFGALCLLHLHRQEGCS